MKSLSSLVFALLFSVLGTNGNAALSFVGNVANITDAGGNQVASNLSGIGTQGNAWALTGGNKTNRGVRLDFAVDQLAGGLWQYTYTFQQGSAAGKNIENFDLQVGSSFQAADLRSATVLPLANSGPTPLDTSPTLITEPLVVSPVNSLTGYQWVFPTGVLGFTVSITSDQAPIWGDFMVLSSDTVNMPAGQHLAAWNSLIGSPSSDPIITGSNDGGRILVPGAVVPEPSGIVLLGIGLVVLLVCIKSGSTSML